MMQMIIAMFSDKPSLKPDVDDEIVVLDSNGNDPSSVVGWAYVGSHNFTPSAWGTLSGSAFSPVMNASCSLLVSVP
jgi:tyrosyl-DNA phosphodiesterase-1